MNLADSSSDHFPCRQEVCLEQKFVVFGSELDLRAHTIEVVSLYLLRRPIKLT